MKHMKKEHVKHVQMCRNYIQGCCRYDTTNCWFKHGDDEKDVKDINENENQVEMMQKLFEMVEKYTQRIIMLENELKSEQHETNIVKK